MELTHIMDKVTATRPDVSICVRTAHRDALVTYEITIHTTNPAFDVPTSCTHRRYSDFRWLRKTLQIHHPLCDVPALPSKHKQLLTEWLYRIVDVNLFLSDTALHLFLQTRLPVRQIDAYTRGQLTEDAIRRAYTEDDDSTCRDDSGVDSDSLSQSSSSDSSESSSLCQGHTRTASGSVCQWTNVLSSVQPTRQIPICLYCQDEGPGGVLDVTPMSDINPMTMSENSDNYWVFVIPCCALTNGAY